MKKNRSFMINLVHIKFGNAFFSSNSSCLSKRALRSKTQCSKITKELWSIDLALHRHIYCILYTVQLRDFMCRLNFEDIFHALRHYFLSFKIHAGNRKLRIELRELWLISFVWVLSVVIFEDTKLKYWVTVLQ